MSEAAEAVHLPSRVPVSTGRSAGCRDGAGGCAQHWLDVSCAVVKLVVEIDRGVDQGEVAEGLREVPELLAGDPDFLGVQPEVVGIGLHLLEYQFGVFQPAGSG